MDRVSPFQSSVLAVPEHVNVALLGARGGGKTTAAVMLAARHIDQHKENAHVLIVRKTYRALSQFEDELLAFMAPHTRGSHTYNRSEKIFRWQGGTISLVSLERTSDYTDKLQGKNVTLLIVDEVTAYQSERLLRLLRSNLRAPEGVPTRVVYCGNPGGPLHGRIYKNHIKDRTSHVPYTIALEDGDEEPWVTILSGPADNPFIDQAAYMRQLRSACYGDPVKLRQWLHGSWEQGEGLMFPSWDPDVHIIRPLPGLPRQQFRAFGAIDFGISSPSVGLLGAIARRDLNGPNGKVPKRSVFVWGEVTDAIFGEDSLNTSSEWPADRLGERFANMAADHGVQTPEVVVDNARGLQGETVIDMIRGSGQFWRVGLPKKGRRAEGWADINARLQAAADKDPHRPHLYIADRCKYLLETLPNAVRDERDPDDWADTPHCPDHGGDALRYLLAEARIRPIRIGRTNAIF